ncbi:MotA/TolQ/ExbB proton channel family protein [Ancylothrix sp. C2]|uniref:MotA/TolQ/ExbB proton channel family protein n=1 Tax=Ancylothrix sp. D3o TaxID=2953691 RepID=UPI0021BA86B8|nr:MotA/TolQ/ExbB proton channel family protein [Ancylothrix sp. D3o]MCT7952149.1 MotA/TolQ/ExbB proton channel family protein [Ancylothrix sp. D3o]
MDNFIYIFRAGGIVSWPLLASSIAAVALIIERLGFWFRVNRRQRRMVKEVLHLYRQNPDTAIKKLQVNADLPLARIFLEALELEDPNAEEFRLALESAAQAEIPVLKRFNTIFDTIISLSPLFGLLGTVLGLITTFAALKLGDIGGTSTTNVTAGISEALVSTAMGLVVAIFTLVFANMFRGFYLQQIAFIQEAAGQLELLYRHRYEQKQKQGEPTYAPTR